jgi:type II secretory pathway predicted ATPase ExeA
VENALNSAKLLVETRGIGLLTGKSGTGKSSLLRMLKESLNPALFRVVYLCHSSIGVHEFYTHLTAGLGLPPKGRRAAMFRAAKERIYSLHTSEKIHPVLIIDEAHLLSHDVLQEIRLLTNFEIDSINALTVLLCGQESLNLAFGLSMLESLASSITINIRLGSLPAEESFVYLEKRISDCGNSATLFTKQALTLIHQAAGGVFRSIGIIAWAAMQKAFMSKATQIEAEHVKTVIER